MGNVRKDGAKNIVAWHYPTATEYAYRDLFQEVVLRALDYLLQVARADGMHTHAPVLASMSKDKVLPEAALVWLRTDAVTGSYLQPVWPCG